MELPDYADLGTGDKSLHESSKSPRSIRSCLSQRKEKVVVVLPLCVCVCVCVSYFKF